MSSPRSQPWIDFANPKSEEHAVTIMAARKLHNEGSENKVSEDRPNNNDIRARPWMSFANPALPAHKTCIAKAEALSVIGLDKAELVSYAAENR